MLRASRAEMGSSNDAVSEAYRGHDKLDNILAKPKFPKDSKLRRVQGAVVVAD